MTEENMSENSPTLDVAAKKRKSRRKLLAVVLSVLCVIALCIGACAVYLADQYRADTEAIDAFSLSYSDVTVSELPCGLAFAGKEVNAGFIFYPGGKVEHTAYTPLMQALASRGVMCVLVKMPFNLAVLDVNAADGIQECYPDIEHWYIGGHSLGGSMAASYIGAHRESFDGLILLGSYSTEDLSDGSERVLSLFGSEDKVMNREKYDSCKKNLPEGFSEFEIDGGCHAYFGMYGEQSGDGVPTVSVQEQIELSALIIASFTEGK